MIPKITKNRMQLREFSILQNPEDDCAVFFITPPEVYPDLFRLRFPDIVKKSRRKEWNLAKHGRSSFLSFEPGVISESDLEVVGEWKERFSQYILLGLNKHIESAFSNELDFCLALDYTFVYEDDDHWERTSYGKMVYQLKQRSNIQTLEILSSGLSKALKELDVMFQTQTPIISIVPSPVDQCNVPRKLAKLVSRDTEIEFVDCMLYRDKQEIKNLPLSDKSPEWDRLYASPEYIRQSGNIQGKDIFLIDDLYQSGTTLWSCAKYLKEAGANCVIGLVCVKNLRDTDNQ